MALNISMPENTELKPRILVFGVGGAGGNGVNNMIDAQLEGVDFVVANTDAQALQRSKTERRVQLGASITEGLGAGARPEVGQQAAEDSIAEILEHLHGVHMCFITAGMGGGTGTGGAPVIARAAREQGILTVGVVTKPFHFEGSRRMRIADEGIEELQQHVDTLIVIPNQNLFRVATEKTTFAEAFGMADQVLHSGVRGITDLMVMPGLINLDFADVRTVMNEMGKAMMGTGEASGERRAVEAAHAAINNPLLDDVSLKGARGVLINITGGMDMTLYEADEAANEIRGEVDPDANIIVGSTFDESLDGALRVSVVATGIETEAEAAQPRRPAQGVTALRGREAVRAPAREAASGPFVQRLMDDGQARGRAPDAAPPEPARPEAQRAPAAAEAPEPAREPAPEAETQREPAPEPLDKPAVVRVRERLAQAAPELRRAAAEASEAQARREYGAGAAAAQSEPAPRAAAQAEAQGPDPSRVRTPERPEHKPARRGLGIFGRRKAQPEPEPRREAQPQPQQRPAVPRTHGNAAVQMRPETGDLFGAEFDESELEIPAFLRRQAN